MSKIGKKPISIKEGVIVSNKDGRVTINGPLGEMFFSLPPRLTLDISDNEILVKRADDEKKTKSIHGTYARLLSNAIEGVKTGFSKSLEIVGTGYRAQMEGETLILWLGFSHPVRFIAIPGIKIEVQDNKIKISGYDKELVGRIADKIKKIKKPDPYKGKGIRYLGEKLKLKPGKAAAKAGAVAAK